MRLHMDRYIFDAPTFTIRTGLLDMSQSRLVSLMNDWMADDRRQP